MFSVVACAQKMREQQQKKFYATKSKNCIAVFFENHEETI